MLSTQFNNRVKHLFYTSVIFCLLDFYSLRAAADQSSMIIAPGATIVVAVSGLQFAEGPANDGSGAVYFTDQPNDRILRWDPASGQVKTFLQPCGRSNGLCFDSAGFLWACADEHNQLWRIDKRGGHIVVVDNYGGKLLNGPNDVWVRPDGGLYITDPYYPRSYWTRGPKEQAVEGVYYIAAISSERSHKIVSYGPPQLVVSDLNKPNGIIGTSDGKTLYVSDIGVGQTFAYDIEPDGALTNKRLFCSMGSDGMTIDNLGDIYLTGVGVTVFDISGVKIDHIDIPQPWTGNICFAGSNERTLFITASADVYTLQMIVHGVGSQ